MWRCKTFMQITPLILTPTGRLSLMMAHEIYLNLLMTIRVASTLFPPAPRYYESDGPCAAGWGF